MADVLLVGSVEVTPPVAAIGPQETVQLSAVPKTSGGLVLPPREVHWSSPAPSIVTVSATGEARAVGIGGPVAVSATIDGVEGTALISVTPVPVARVTVAPSQAGLPVGGTLQLTATAFDAAGAVLKDRSFFWESSAPSIAPVTTGGLVIAQADGGPVAITATTGGKSGQASVSVAPRPATRLGFVQQPPDAVTGHVLVPAVRVAVQDDLLHTITSATNSITLALAGNPSGATLGGTLTVAAVTGVATFTDLTLDHSGTGFTLLATSGSLSAAISLPFDVGGFPAKLSVNTQPAASAQSGVVLTRQPVVLVTDATNNPVSGAVVLARVSAGNGTLGGSATATSNAKGFATFTDLSLAGAIGNYKLGFSEGTTLSVNSNTISLSAGAASQLSITTQPPGVTLAGAKLSPRPVVQLRDAQGNAVSQSGVAVTAALASGPSGGTLGGTLTVTTSAAGAASFANLTLSRAGTYTLRFSAGGLASVVSSSIRVP